MGPGAAGSGLSGGPSGSLLAFGYDFHRFFYPRLDGESFVGRDFIIRIPVLSWNEFIIFAYETSDVTIRDTVDTVVATRTLPAGGFFATTGSPLAAGTVYRVTSTGDIALMSNSQNGYTSVPSRNGTDVGTEFLFGTRVWEAGEESARPSTHEASYRKQAQQLKRLLAEKTLEVDFFKGALQKVEARRQRSGNSGETASTTRSEK